MKKPIVITLTILAGFIVIGMFLILAFAGFNFKSAFGRDVRELKTWSSEETVSAIDIDVSDENVTFCPSEDGSFHVEYYESEKHKISITCISGDFSMKSSSVVFGIDIPNRDYTITVYMPENDLESLGVSVSSGNIDFDFDIHIGEVSAGSSSGNITIGGFDTEKLLIDITSGNAQLSDINAASLSTVVTSGDISLDSVAASALTMDSTSGDIELSGCSVKELSVKSTSGRLTSSALELGSADIEATSGDVALGIASDDASLYRMQLDTSSGSVRVHGGGYDLDTEGSAALGSGDSLIRIDVSSGDISLAF